jgi:NTP pyrophosphatase (non-canonical NTP hydrolase)
MSFAEIEMKVIQWTEARKIIPNATPRAQFTKLIEEVDELREGLEKNDLAEIKDAIGDTVVVLINMCALLDVDLVDCLAGAYEEIKDRKGHLTPEGIFVKEQKHV